MLKFVERDAYLAPYNLDIEVETAEATASNKSIFIGTPPHSTVIETLVPTAELVEPL